MSTLPVFIQPADIDGELNDQDLQDFLQVMMAGITGLDGTLVRPRWQPTDPPNQPDLSTNWAALGVVRKERDNFEFQGHVPSSVGFAGNSFVIRHQVLHVLASFYGPTNESYSERLAMGLGLAQNRWYLTQAGYGLVEVGESVTVPAKINNQWVNGTDLPFSLRRRQKYTYSVAEINIANVVINIDNPVKQYVVKIQEDS
jgi:hypothetical protein